MLALGVEALGVQALQLGGVAGLEERHVEAVLHLRGGHPAEDVDGDHLGADAGQEAPDHVAVLVAPVPDGADG